MDAPPEAIWPWLVQMGPGRGGAYTYDWIENLFGLGMHSADTILPEFQDLKVGDAQRLGARGPVLRVAVLEPRRALVTAVRRRALGVGVRPGAGRRGHQADQPEPDRGASGPAVTRLVYEYVMEPGSLIMERKMLLGIKERAERLPRAA